MLGVYIVLSAGLAVALVTLAAEIYWKRTAKHVLANKVQTGNRRLVRLFYQGLTLQNLLQSMKADLKRTLKVDDKEFE